MRTYVHATALFCCLLLSLMLSRRYHDLAAKDEGRVLYDTFVQRCKVLQWLHALCMTGLNILHSPKGINVASPPALCRVHVWLPKLQLLWKVYYIHDSSSCPNYRSLLLPGPPKCLLGRMVTDKYSAWTPTVPSHMCFTSSVLIEYINVLY